MSCLVVSYHVAAVLRQATRDAVRKQHEEEQAMQADELGFKKCVRCAHRVAVASRGNAVPLVVVVQGDAEVPGAARDAAGAS